MKSHSDSSGFYTLAPEAPFLEGVAEMLWQRCHAQPLALARTLLLLPTRRACRQMQELWRVRARDQALLLPRILPIGELGGEADLLPLLPDAGASMMPEPRRLALLSRLIRQRQSMSPAQAYYLARALGAWLDEVTEYGLDFSRLQELVPMELASHWEQTTEFLTLITRYWPRILAEEGAQDAASVYQQRMRALVAHWTAHPPNTPIIAAGSTGTHPTTAALLACIARLPQGMVILPGLDREASAEYWQVVDPTHPQYAMKSLLQRAEVGREEVRVLDATPTRRNETLAAVFAPAALTSGWSQEALPVREDLRALRIMEAEHQADEARMIAYQLRETLETPGKTAALITTDRKLARMVAAQCMRWGLRLDDSAGQPLAHTPAAVFMRLLLDVAQSGAAPVPLLAWLQHPLTCLGTDAATVRGFARQLELQVLRDVRLQPGLDALLEVVQADNADPGILPLLVTLRDRLRPLEMLFLRTDPLPLQELLACHRAVAELCASSDAQPGAERLWKGEDGAALAALCDLWIEHAEAVGLVAAQDYPALWEAWLAPEVTRPTYGTHPRLHILSPMEARLLKFDRVILGELSASVWPGSGRVDPWMSVPMREAFGLPPESMHVGQQAHDVWQGLHAPEVFLTRARKIDSTPQQPSRWWVRLCTLAEGVSPGWRAQADLTSRMEALIRGQDAALPLPPLTAPSPKPPKAARPRRFSPSSLQLWKGMPYSFYARYILKLRPLMPLDQEPDQRDFGMIMHRVLELFSAAFPDHLPESAYQQLLNFGRQVFQPYLHRPAITALWWPRFDAMARHWILQEQRLRAEGSYRTLAESSAVWEWTLAGESIRIEARADRVDLAASGGFRLMDYKTGTPPTRHHILSGEAIQLPVTALTLGQAHPEWGPVASLAYASLRPASDAVGWIEVAELEGLFEKTQADLVQIMTHILSESTGFAPQPISKRPVDQDDYHHLSRRGEWGEG